ncbi:MAG: hypothetical protein WC603_00760 [Candidatus Paceibacterota bacterium]|jgi:hypothetical protein
MENSFQTSFIPKKPITSAVSDKAPRSLLLIIAIFLLVVSALGSLGLFVYKNYLTKHKESLSSSLAVVRDTFEKETVDELSLFNKRTETAKQILNNHIVLTPLFTRLGEITIPSVQYTSFSHMTTDKGFVVRIDGLARDYRSIALQADAFNTPKGQVFKDVIFSEIVKDKSNKISFKVEFSVDPTLLSYEKNSLIEKIQNPVIPDPVSMPLSPSLENNTP